MPKDDTRPPPRLRDQALALWLLSLGLLGMLRFAMRAVRDGTGGADAVAWAYLVGGALVALCGAKAWRRRPPPG
ncbi:hypothetical protein [Marilutibacter aestuarii]|uniref:Uncharacterized protein n=1 Tax=Marilutibacter aestuarii TaxID=1706195 RepID=A0A508AWW4_9GAMM|nr:hypothetical protein [Lysobacter aestuarii]TQD51575.1 hypothetical protein FKV25_00865 [Lysobacter aestuarii]